MIQDSYFEQIIELQKEIDRLPEGSITQKTIKGSVYYYHRIRRDGKRIEKYIRKEDLPALSQQIRKRKELEKKQKELKYAISQEAGWLIREEPFHPFRTNVITGARLQRQIASVRSYRKRECIQALREYIFTPQQERVFILYGLRRTGKTTMIRQILNELEDTEFRKAAYIQLTAKDTLADLDTDLRILEQNGYRYIFLDEVTLLEDFIEGSALFSDLYASAGMKIVLSGTDSLGFAFAKEEQLYDRCILLHTTFIPYREFEEVPGCKGIDEYIRYGGTMSRSGIHYNPEPVFATAAKAEEYIDSAIANNIQHSLRRYQYGGHFRQLFDLHEKGELTNVINRVVEIINHRFARSVIEKTFRSHDLAVTTTNLLKDRTSPINLKEHIHLDAVTSGMMKMLEILNKEEQSIDIQDAHMQQIKEFLTMLDLIAEIDLEYLPDVVQKSSITVLTQPGLRYAQASALVENLLSDGKFRELSAIERKRILERLLSEIQGRMLEEIILFETKMARPSKKVCKLQFAAGEFDMVVYDPEELTCEIYEVKHSKERTPEQYHHLIDAEKCRMTVHRYGEIIGRFVIYRGENAEEGDITYLNAEDYLKSL